MADLAQAGMALGDAIHRKASQAVEDNAQAAVQQAAQTVQQAVMQQLAPIVAQAVQAAVQPLHQSLQGLRQDVESLRGDVQGLRRDVQGLRQDVESLRGDMQNLALRQRNGICCSGAGLGSVPIRWPHHSGGAVPAHIAGLPRPATRDEVQAATAPLIDGMLLLYGLPAGRDAGDLPQRQKDPLAHAGIYP